MSKILVLDTETGGLSADKNSILSFGAVVFEDLVPTNEIEVYVKEDDIQVEKRAMEVNKIDLNWLKANGKSPIEAVSLLEKFIADNFGTEKVSPAGHNIGFDVRFMNRLFRLAGKNYDDVFSHRTLDTASILRFLTMTGKINMKTASADEAFKYFDIKISTEKRHTALGDAKATAEMIVKLAAIVKG